MTLLAGARVLIDLSESRILYLSEKTRVYLEIPLVDDGISRYDLVIK
jgi:hypothetical protein